MGAVVDRQNKPRRTVSKCCQLPHNVNSPGFLANPSYQHMEVYGRGSNDATADGTPPDAVATQ